MATTKLGLWNSALTELGDYALSDTGEQGTAGRALTQVYDEVVAECLAAGSWNFATETVKLEADTGIEPAFGHAEVFAKPADWVATHAVSQDENFTAPLLYYYDDVNYFSADVTPIYVRYVSDDTGLGLELSRWPARFKRYVALELAARVAHRVGQTSANGMVVLERKLDRARRRAKNQDAMNEANPKFMPPNSWTRSRGSVSGRERGSRNSLTG